MKLLITGASGLFGSKLAELATKQNHKVISTFSAHPAHFGTPMQLDVTEKTKVQSAILQVSPDVVVHSASMTDVDKCEQQMPIAWKINVEGTENVALAAKACGSFLLYISSDYVFDGDKGCYSESDLPSPISYYAYTKLKAEEKVHSIAKDSCVIRPSVIYGATPAAGKVNFALWLLDKLRRHEQAKVFVDQWNSPTLNSSLAEMTLEACERRLPGIWHMSGATRISRFDFGVQLAKTFGFDASVLVASSMRDVAFAAKRPRDSSLKVTKAQKALNNRPIEIEQAFARFKAEVEASV